MIELKNLYGGAICAYVPSDACDISKIREVPDNQEVFAHMSTDQSIIFDIMQYETSVTDDQAAEYHFKDLTGSDSAQIASIKKLSLSNMPTNCDSVYYLVGQNQMAKYHESAKNLVNLHVALFRFKAFETDILITFNDPVYISPESSSYDQSSGAASNESNQQNEAIKWTVDQFMKTIETLRIVDPNLFNAN